MVWGRGVGDLAQSHLHHAELSLGGKAPCPTCHAPDGEWESRLPRLVAHPGRQFCHSLSGAQQIEQ